MCLLTEEDVRTKVVVSWLADHGFEANEFCVEPAFKLTFGRQTKHIDSSDSTNPKRYRPRADLLVRHIDGRNLMIIETKAPGETLDERARMQGISYARLLQNGGGMPPFVIVTNGRESLIFDVLSEQPLDQSSIPREHPYARSNFKLSVNDLGLRAEALERLITLNPENLVDFCAAQARYRMRLLRADDPCSGRKYIPSLYIDRPRVETALEQLINEGRRVILVIGPPQQGKTNVMCRAVEKRLTAGQPTLFLPAVSIGGILEELREDFEWEFHHSISGARQAADRLIRVAQESGQRLVLFVDGWNEAEFHAARAIDAEGDRLAGRDITLVVSMTSVAARRLLIDPVGNPSALADAAGISAKSIPLLQLNGAMPDGWSVVHIGEFDADEAQRALRAGAKVFKVQVPELHKPTRDPLLLRTALETYRGKLLPASYAETDLIENRISTKIDRAKLHDPELGRLVLRQLGEVLFAAGGPVGYEQVVAGLGIPPVQGIPDGLFEAGLLMRRPGPSALSQIDFYYARERDYVIAHWVRKWPARLAENPQSIRAEVEHTIRSEAGLDALRWFLTRVSNIAVLQAGLDDFRSATNIEVRRFLMSCASQAALAIQQDEEWETDGAERDSVGALEPTGDSVLARSSTHVLDWLESVVEDAAADPDPIVKAHAAKLLAIWADDSESIAELITQESTVIRELLLIDETAGLDSASVGKGILDAFKVLGDREVYDMWDESTMSSLLLDLAADPSPIVQKAALTAYGHVSPWPFLRLLSTKIEARTLRNLEFYTAGLEYAVGGVEEYYWGPMMCPGYWNIIQNDWDARRKEYDERYPLFWPIIRHFAGGDGSKRLHEILDVLEPTPAEIARIPYCGCQLDLPLDTRFAMNACGRPCWACHPLVLPLHRNSLR